MSSWVRFDPTLTWDGLLTLSGGVLALLAVLYQVRRADVNILRQFERERLIRHQDDYERQRRVGVALLFEINSHYTDKVRDVLRHLEEYEKDPATTVIKPPAANPFPVYVQNAGTIGALPSVLVEGIVSYYGLLENYFGTLKLYARGYDMLLEGQHQCALMKSLIPRIKSEALGITQVTYTVCGMLCEFVGIEFSSPRIGVEADAKVDDIARATLIASRAQLVAELGRI